MGLSTPLSRFRPITDLDWHHGNGPEIRGPAEALLMAFAGRADALPDLEGEGLAPLTQRVQR